MGESLTHLGRIPDRFLAVDGQAHYIISGDADLLEMHPFRGIPIVRAADFLEMVLSERTYRLCRQTGRRSLIPRDGVEEANHLERAAAVPLLFSPAGVSGRVTL